MKIIQSENFDSYWRRQSVKDNDEKTEKIVRKIIETVEKRGNEAVIKYASMFDKSSPQQLEVPAMNVARELEKLKETDSNLKDALEVAAKHINRFCLKQKEQFVNFDYEMGAGILTGQRVIPVEKAAVYVPGGHFPLFSSVLMGLIPAFCAGVEEVILASPPAEDGLPNRTVLAAAAIAAEVSPKNKLRVFSMGGAQAIAALAFGTETVPRVDVITGPGNKYVAAAKKILYGQVGIDFIAGPSDVLIISDGSVKGAAELAAADMIAQAEHDPDARARALVPNKELAYQISAAVKKRLETLPTAKNARASLDSGGLIVIYENKDEAVRIANIIAPEHLELQTSDDNCLVDKLKNYGSLFIGALSAEALGDYSAGLNHTLPTSGSARFTGGLSVRHFLKTVTTLKCARSEYYVRTAKAAQIIARAEGLEGHAQSVAGRR